MQLVLPSMSLGLMLSFVWLIISFYMNIRIFSMFNYPSVITSLTFTSSSPCLSFSTQYNAPYFIQLSKEKLDFPAWPTTNYYVHFFSNLYNFLQICDSPDPYSWIQCHFLQYLFHMKVLHKEFVEVLKYHKSLQKEHHYHDVMI